MSETDQQRWDKRYSEGAYESRLYPNALVEQWVGRPAPGHPATALDVACGAGRNSLHLAALGYQCHGWDISTVALERARAKATAQQLAVDFKHIDLDDAHIPASTYDVIIVIRYLNRALIESICEGLKPGGMLVYEQHLQTERPEVGGPRRTSYRFAVGELAESFRSLTQVHYYEGVIDDPDGKPMEVAQLVANKPSASL